MTFKPVHIIAFIAVFALNACTVKYSFSGKSISPDVKTFTVSYIENRAPKIQPTLSDVFTEGLKDKFITQAGLAHLNRGGDLEFSGSIINYSTSYQGVTAEQEASQTRLTIGVKISFVNNTEPSKNFEKTFSDYRDFDASENLSSVEDQLIAEIAEKIIDDIFMASVADW